MREAVHNYIDIVDEQGLRMVYALLKEYSLPAVEFDKELLELLDHRRSEIETKQENLLTVEDAFRKLTKNKKSAK